MVVTEGEIVVQELLMADVAWWKAVLLQASGVGAGLLIGWAWWSGRQR